MIVQKFGGTSVESASAIERLVEIVRGERYRSPVVVVSAMAGVTNGLLECAALPDVLPALERLQAVLARHEAVLLELAAEADRAPFLERLQSLFAEAAQAVSGLARSRAKRKHHLVDALVATGELASSIIVTAALRAAGLPAEWVDIRPLLATTADHGRARVLLEEASSRMRGAFLPLVREETIAVTQGFIGATLAGQTTTIGRGGSDYSAALVGAALEAQEIQIWTDVDGIMTTDPRIVPDARPIETISFAEAAELAYFGAKVLHPATLHPAMANEIPVRVLNSRNPEGNGTTIVRLTPVADAPVRAIAMKTGITVVKVTSDRMLMAYGFLARIFNVFMKHRTSIDMVTTSEVSVSMTLDDTRRLDRITAALQEFGDVTIDREQAIVCLVGDSLKSEPGLVARVFGSVKNLPVSMISHGASAINISFVLPETAAREAVVTLHREFFSGVLADRE